MWLWGVALCLSVSRYVVCGTVCDINCHQWQPGTVWNSGPLADRRTICCCCCCCCNLPCRAVPCCVHIINHPQTGWRVTLMRMSLGPTLTSESTPSSTTHW